MKFFRSLFFSLGLLVLPMMTFAQGVDLDALSEQVQNLDVNDIQSLDVTGALDAYDYAGASAGGGIVTLLVQLLIGVVVVVSMWKIFEKAGKPGWAGIVPIYNTFVLLEIVKKPWWWLLLMFIPIVGLVFAVMILHRLSLSFGRSYGTTAGLALLPFVFFPILAFGDAKFTQLAE